MPQVDRWALARLLKLRDEVTAAYDQYRFFTVYRLCYDYIGELSNVYLDMLKDRLYSDAAGSLGRRSAQTVLANILEVLVRVLCPILSFTCDEVWDHYPESMKRNCTDRPESVQLAGWPDAADLMPNIPEGATGELLTRFQTVLAARDVVTKALEDARNAKVVGKSQEAAVVLSAPAAMVDVLTALGEEALEELFIIAHIELVAAEGEPQAVVSVAAGEKCPRCWNIRELGADGLCGRCSQAVAACEESR